MQDARLYEEIARGQMAKDLLNNEMLKEALEVIEKVALESWKKTDKESFSERERLWQKMQIVEEFRSELTRYLETGKLAKAQVTKSRKSKRH